MTLTPEFVAKLLHRQGALSPEQVETVNREAKALPSRKGDHRAYEQRATAYDVITRLNFPSLANPAGYVDEVEIAENIAKDANLKFVRIDPLALDADLIESKISRPFAKRHRMLPLEHRNGKLIVACANPFDIESIDAFRRIAESELQLTVAAEPDILRAINEFYGLRHSVKRAERDLSGGIDLGNLEQLVRMKSESEIE
jgi:general secretion pathway protein E